ncbi:MAG: beta-ketoacyl-[acyl-carrier-protein] synthase family protein [Deltaproteobacteria bacterium]|nr:beta-ketoacyl-[acyl-carrier-protein] synthase family protein [Deltaproteobacteria bacterium]
MRKRVVITAMGVCSSLGNSEEQIIDNLTKKNVSFSRHPFDDELVVSPVQDFNIRDIIGRFKERRYLNRGAQFCVATAIEAIKNSGIKEEVLAEAGLFMGTGPNLDMGGEFPEILKGKIDREDLMALWMLRFLPNTAASAIAKYYGIHGENLTITTACAASLQAIGEAFRKIKDGHLNLAFAGGGDSRLSPGGILAYKKANALYTGSGDPEKASRPFDVARKGFVPGEGGAVFLLEEMEHARRRGVLILAEVCGYGSSIDGYNMTAPEPSATWGEKALLSALQEAAMSPGDIDVVSAHGTGTPLNDEMEAGLLGRVFEKQAFFVIAIKSWIGHIAAACGALELAVVLACLKHNYLPEVRNLDEPCHGEINFVRQGTASSAETVLLENFGFGGQNSALIIKKSTR